VEKIRHPRSKRKLPVVLDISEVNLFFRHEEPQHKVILMMTYSSGLRASKQPPEADRYRQQRMTVRVNDARAQGSLLLLSQTTLSFYGILEKNIGHGVVV